MARRKPKQNRSKPQPKGKPHTKAKPPTNQQPPDKAGGQEGWVRVIVLALFACSGAAGLIHEVSWTRLLRLVMGNTTYSMATVLGVFMGGLALGSYLAGRLIDRRRDPLRVFGLLEIAVGLSCLMMPLLIGLVEPLYRAAYQAEVGPAGMAALRLALCGLLLLVPSTLMGATLPVLSRWFVRSRDQAGRGVAALYAINTLGAAAGASTTAFLLIPTLGLSATIGIGAAANIVIGAVGLFLHARVGPVDDAPDPDRAPAPAGVTGRQPQTDQPAYGPQAIRVLLLGYGMSGMAAMLYQIAWTRVLALLIGSSVYAFGLIVTAFIIGVGLGSLAYAPFADRAPDPLRRLAWIQFVIGFSSLAVAPLFGLMPFFIAEMISERSHSFAEVQKAEFLLALGVMIVPTLMMGAAFPLVTRAYARRDQSVGRSVGAAYSCNTIGGIVGSLLGGFALIPTLGIQGTIFAAVAISVLVGAAFLLASFVEPLRRKLVASGLALAATGGAVLILPGWNPAHMSIGPFVHVPNGVQQQLLTRKSLEKIAAQQEVLFYQEGVSATVTVRRNRETEVIELLTNGRVEAASKGGEQQQRLLAHLPLLLHPDPRDVALIGLASGMTLDAAAQHPVETFDCIELSPGVVTATRFFDEANNKVLDDPRLRLVLADGRNHLSLTDRRYDVIISQPSDPASAGVANLFTREFFQTCYDRLEEPGFVCVWLKAHAVEHEVFRSVVEVFSEVFDGAGIWSATNFQEFMLVGSRGPMAIDLSVLRERIKDPEIADDMRGLLIADVPSLARYFVVGRDAMREFAAGAPPHLDDRPTLEFAAPRALYSPGSHLSITDALLRVRDNRIDWLKAPPPAGDDEVQKVRDRSRQVFKARELAYRAATTKAPKKAFEMIKEACRLNPKESGVLAEVSKARKRAKKAIAGGNRKSAISLLRTIIDLYPDSPVDLDNLALQLISKHNRSPSDCAEAVELATHACELTERKNPLTLNTLALAHERTGDMDRALAVTREALESVKRIEATTEATTEDKDRGDKQKKIDEFKARMQNRITRYRQAIAETEETE